MLSKFVCLAGVGVNRQLFVLMNLDTILKVRVERCETPEDYIPDLLARVKLDYIKKTYRLVDWTDANDFLEQVAQRTGKLLKVKQTKLFSLYALY